MLNTHLIVVERMKFSGATKDSVKKIGAKLEHEPVPSFGLFFDTCSVLVCRTDRKRRKDVPDKKKVAV